MTDTKLYVVNVQKKCKWGNKFSKELEYLFQASKNSDAVMLTFFSDNPAAILNDCIERRNVKHVVMEDMGIKTVDLLKQLDVKSNEIEIHICNIKLKG